METQRQRKVSSLLKKDLSNIIQSLFREHTRQNLLISVTKVNVSIDLSHAKVYVSVFPSNMASKSISFLQQRGLEVKKKFSSLAKNQLRIIPNFEFYIDDSLDYIDEIDKALKKGDNPIK